MNINCGEVEFGFLVNLETLREVLKAMSTDGRSWRVESDPEDSADSGWITIGHDDLHRPDRLNTLYFRFPLLDSATPSKVSDRVLVVIDPSTFCVSEPGYYLENSRVMQDPLEDYFCFYRPIERALIERWHARTRSTKEDNGSPSFL